MSEFRDQLIQSGVHLFFAVERRSDGGKQVGILRHDSVFAVQVQGPHEGLAQLTQEMQGTSEEGDMSADRTSAGEA